MGYRFCAGPREQRAAHQGPQGRDAARDARGALAQPRSKRSDWECSTPNAPHNNAEQVPATALEAVLHHSEFRNAERRQTGFQ